MPVGAGPIDRPLISAAADAATARRVYRRRTESAARLAAERAGRPFAPATTTSAAPRSQEPAAGRATATATSHALARHRPQAGDGQPTPDAELKLPSLQSAARTLAVAAERPAATPDAGRSGSDARPCADRSGGRRAVGASAATAGMAFVRACVRPADRPRRGLVQGRAALRDLSPDRRSRAPRAPRLVAPRRSIAGARASSPRAETVSRRSRQDDAPRGAVGRTRGLERNGYRERRRSGPRLRERPQSRTDRRHRTSAVRRR